MTLCTGSNVTLSGCTAFVRWHHWLSLDVDTP
jgi:hypothetical protein